MEGLAMILSVSFAITSTTSLHVCDAIFARNQQQLRWLTLANNLELLVCALVGVIALTMHGQPIIYGTMIANITMSIGLRVAARIISQKKGSD